MAISGRIRVNFPYFYLFSLKILFQEVFSCPLYQKNFLLPYTVCWCCYCSVLLLLCLVTAFSSGCGSKASLDPAKPVTLTIWHVYGNQTNSPFNDTIEKFNASEGKAKGVIVKVASVSSSNVIDKALFASAKQDPGAVPLPDLFTAYPRVIPAMHDKLLHWDKYLDKEDLAVYQPEFLAEGYQDKELLMLPVAKSTELLFVNQTYFDRFAAATGASTEDFADYDKLFELCRKYYTWTGGKNMCQLDDFYNYYLTSMASLGDPLIKDGKPDLASPNFKRIFRAAAEPAIAGGLGIEKGYAADAWKTADLISNVGSTAAILYMRDYVTNPDNTRETIVTNYYPCPVFSGGKVTLLQRGVGLLAIKSTDERKNLGAVVFAKWLAQENSNLNFAMQAGYLPTNKEALPKLLNNPQDVHNFNYRKLYTCMQQVYKKGTWLHLPHKAAKIQQNLEYGSKNILRAAHQQYLQEIAGGANPQQTLDKLVEESYQKLLNYKQ